MSAAEDPRCPRCSAPERLATLADGEIDELSGIVAGSKQSGVFFVHNDSGDSPRFFAIDAKGALLATFDVGGAKANDWEDIARGPCALGSAASCLYLGDIGDNGRSRSDCTIYRVPEPDVPLGAPAQRLEVRGDAIPFVYPDGPHDAETLLVHPSTGAITIVTKEKTGESGVYEVPMPLRPGERVTLTKAGEVSPPDGINLFTGGDVEPSARGVLLRTYTSVFYYPISSGQSVAGALGGAPCVLPAPVEAQGEAIGFLASGDGYVTASEGKHTPLYRVRFVTPPSLPGGAR